MVELETGSKIKCLRMDNWKEYCNAIFNGYLKSNGIKHQTTVQDTPEQNGVAERANKMIVEKATTLLQEAGLEKVFLAEAVNTVIYLKNKKFETQLEQYFIKSLKKCGQGRVLM